MKIGKKKRAGAAIVPTLLNGEGKTISSDLNVKIVVYCLPGPTKKLHSQINSFGLKSGC
jgi:hypothetical protein